MISLVVTVIVVVILAMMVIQTSSSLPSDATYAKFSEELTSVEGAIESIRTQNAGKGDAEEIINAGFRKVTLKNAPGGFESFDVVGVKTTGYIVDLNIIGYNNAEFGQDYDEGKTEIEFLKDDIYVYDATGTVYYAKGIEYKSEIIHSLLEGMDLGMESTADGPIITNVTVTSGELADGTKTSGKAKITISAFPRFNGELTVMVRNIVAEKMPNGTYVAQVSRNGIYTIAVTEKDGGRTVQRVNVTGIIEMNEAPSNLSMVVNNGEGFTKERLVDVILRADGATKMMITKDNPLKPNSSDEGWVEYKTNIEFDLGNIEKRITLYAWFKDEFANVTDQIVKATIVYDKTSPSITKPTVVESGPYVILTSNQKDNLAADTYLLSKTEYGYRLYDGLGAYEDDYTWQEGKLIGPLTNKTKYEFVTRTEDEAGNKSLSEATIYTINYDYIINFDLQGGVGSVETVYAAAGESIKLAMEAPTKMGYVFVGWSEKQDALPEDEVDVITPEEEYTPTGSDIQKKLYAIWAPRTDMEYKVNHYVEREGMLGEYELKLTETFTGTVGKLAYAVPKTSGDFFGFVENEAHSQRVGMAEIKGDGSTELRLYYYRGKFNLTVLGENASVIGTMIDVPYESEVEISAVPNSGYDFDRWVIEGVPETSEEYNNFVNEKGKWSQNATFKMPGRNTTIIAKTGIQKFAITYELNGGILAANNPTEYTRETPEFTLYNPTKTGYSFAGWTGTDLIQNTINVTVNPATLVNMRDRHYEAVFVPTEELLTITANPTTPTNTTVRAIIECLDPALRLEYRIGSEGTWDMYVSSIPINENTTVYARVLEEGIIIDEEALVINNIDTVAPEITDIEISEKWKPGEKLLVKVTAEDNLELKGYAVTTTNVEPDDESYKTTNDEIELENGTNYIWVKDTAGNVVSKVVNAWDISESENREVYAFLKEENELTIAGTGKTKSYQESNAPYQFYKDKIEIVKVEKGITSLGNHTLSSMKKVSEIYFPSTLSEIMEDTMIYTNKFEKIEIAEGNNYFVYDNYTLYDKDKTTIYLHSAADQRIDYIMPTTVETIKKFAFYDNDNINRIVTTSNPTVGESAFEDCDELYRIDGEIGGTKIETRAFAECQNLHLITLSSELKDLGAASFANTVRLSVLEIPKTLETIFDADASQKGVFANIGVYSEGAYPKGVVRYYQSTKVMHLYATKYSTEAIFEVIDDIAPEFVSLSVTSPETGTYAREQEITIVAEFNEELGIDETTVIPSLIIKVGNGIEKKVTTAVIEGKQIKYTYVAAEEDFGKLELVSYNGTVQDLAGNRTDVSTTIMTGSEITINTAIEMYEDEEIYYFATLQKAIDAARTDGAGRTTIRLLKDINESVVISANKDIILDLNNQDLTTTQSAPVITNRAKLEINSYGTITSENVIVKNEGNSTLTVSLVTLETVGANQSAITGESNSIINVENATVISKGTTIETSGKLNVSSSSVTTETGPAINLVRTAEAKLIDATIESHVGYAINISSEASVEISSGTVTATGGAAINNNNTLKLSESCYIKGTTGIISNKTLEIQEAIIEATSEEGSAVENSGTVNMYGGTLKSNVGTVIFNLAGTFEITDGKIESTSSKETVRNNTGARFTMTDGDVTSTQGNAIYNLGILEIKNEAQVTSSGENAINNRASLTMDGGKIHLGSENGTIIENSGTATITNAVITSAGKCGINNTLEGYVTLTNSTLEVETKVNVNGINTTSIGIVKIEKSTILAKTGEAEARGINLGTGARVEIIDSTVIAISAGESGYGIYNLGGTVTMGNSEDIISADSPVVEGNNIGYYSSGGILNYYDGNFIGKVDNSIKGTVTRKPEKSYVAYIVTDEREKSYLELDVDAPTNVHLTASTTDWTNKMITIFGEATDEGSGVIEYAITHTASAPADDEWTKLNAPQKEFSTTFTVTESNTYYLHVKDQTGNTAVSNGVETKYDATAPKIDSIEKIPSTWTSGDVTIKMNASDAASGIIGYEFSKVYHDLNTKGNNYTTVDPVVNAIEQTYISDNAIIYIYVYDQAGNVAYNEVEIDNVDKIDPTINVEFVQYQGTAATVKVTAKDFESGVNAIYMNDIEQLTTDTEDGKTVTCLIEHSGVIEFKATDNVGNDVSTTIEAYVITYSANGGEGTVESQIKLKDQNRTIAENKFTREKFEFVNWNTSDDGTGTIYNPGDEYAGNENLALYAIWRDIEPPEILDVTLSPDWTAGSDVLLRILAHDNVEVTRYAITTTADEPTTWSASEDVTITLGNELYYVWAKDEAGNMTYVEIDVYDLSEATAPKTVVGIVKPNGETSKALSIEGSGAIKDMTDAAAPWESKVPQITTVSIAEGITKIGSKALSGFTSASTINISSTVTDIELDAFMHTTNYTTLTVAGTNFKVEEGILYDDSGTNLYVASSKVTTGSVELLLSVQTIAPYAFENSIVTELTISENINLPEGAFYNAKNLSRIIADRGIGGTTIGASAFEGCESLTELNLSTSLENIGARAFYGTTKLTDIVISKTLKTIEGTEVFVNIGTEAGTDTGKGYVRYYESNAVMSAYATNAATKDQATFIGIDDIPPVVEEVLINDGAIITNNNTVKVNVTATDNHEVDGIYITEDGTVDPHGTMVEWLEFTTGEYEYVLSVGTEEKTIYVWAKDNSGNVSTVSKSASITFVDYTFNLKGETEIIQYVDTTGKDYYEYREPGYSLEGEGLTVEISGDVNHEIEKTYEIEYILKYNGTKVETLVRTVDVIPNSWDTTVRIEGNFRYVTHATGEYVKIIGYTNSSNSNVLEIPNTIAVNGKDYKVIDVGDGTNAISSTDANVATVILPNNIIAVSNNAFSAFIELGNLLYQNNLMTIGAYAFANSNSSYTDFEIKNNVREVKEGAFNNTKVHNITIEEGVKAIYENAFASRYNVAEGQVLTIPASIDYIGTKAFYGYKASEIAVDDANAKYVDVEGKLLANKEGTIAYQYALGNEAVSYVVPAGIETIADGAFAEAPSLKEVTLSDSVTRLGNESFKFAVMLENVLNIQNLEQIGESAFENTSLVSFEIPTKVQEILANTFKNTNLAKVYIPENITSIGSGAFANCSSLEEAIFEKATSMSGDVFNGSALLKYILVFDETEKIGITSTLKMPGSAKIYVLNKTLETAYEADTAWGTLGNNRILCIAELNGEAEIELVNNEEYIEEGIMLLEEKIVMNGASSKVQGLEVVINTTLDASMVGEYTVTYEVKYNSETILELERLVKVIDTIPPIIMNITTDSSWTSGTNLKLNVQASDNRGDTLDFSVTGTPNTDGAVWSESNVVTLTQGTNYINVRDDSNNVATAIVKVWDISKNRNQAVIAYEKENGELIITGAGETADIAARGETPWKDDVTLITKLTLEEGITHLGKYILSGLENVNEITIPDTLSNSANVDGTAFAGTNNFNVINVSENNGAFKLENRYTLLSKDGQRIYLHGRKDSASSIVINSNVKYISDSAYYMNNMLEELEFLTLVDIDKSAFEYCLNLGIISGEIGNTYIESEAFSGDINMTDIVISKTVENLGTGIFTNVLGPVYYYASDEAMSEYAATYPDETEFKVIDDVGPTDDAPTLRASSSTIVVKSNQVDQLSEIVSVEYIYRIEGEEYAENGWGSNAYFIGLKDDTKYFVKTRATDSKGNTTESKESSIVTAKVPETIEITAKPSTPTSGDVTVIVEWPIDEMNNLYNGDWPEGTSVTKQIGIRNQGDSEPMWIDMIDTERTYQYNVTQNNTTIFARLYDGYNFAQATTYTVGNIDRVAPTGTVIINNGDEEVYDHEITLALSATDDRNEEGYGVKYYYVSENPSVDLSNVTWNTYTDGTTYEYTLTGSTSLKTLYVWYMDAAGNVSASASDSIMLVTGVARLDQNNVTTYYDTLKEAIAAATDSPIAGASKITLIRNISNEGNLTIGKNKNIVLDMRGKNISETSTTDVTAITNEGVLTIINSSSDASAIYAVTTSGKAYGIYNTGLLDVTTVSIIAETASGTGTGIYNKNTEG
ncbi:MAG: leucine-rich repeat protein [Clostridia bacterium]|nr:leucine-rich repeat protein [Clostridia bacterium]